MANRRKNYLDPDGEGGQKTEPTLSLAEAKKMFLRDIRLLSPDIQRWHKENLTALEKVLAKQTLEISDVQSLTARMVKENFVFYMFEDMGLMSNTINGRVRSVRALLKFLHREGHISKDFGEENDTAESFDIVMKYVIGPDVAIYLAGRESVICNEHKLLAPTLIRSQVLSRLYHAVRHSEMTRKDAERRLNYIRGLRIRLLGDRVLQSAAWKVADALGWTDTFDAEYVALTQLQAEAFITLDLELADAVKDLVTVSPIEELLCSPSLHEYSS